jgi:hypothetical protein
VSLLDAVLSATEKGAGAAVLPQAQMLPAVVAVALCAGIPQATVDSFQPTITELTSARVKAELATVELRAKLQVSCEAARRWLRVKL